MNPKKYLSALILIFVFHLFSPSILASPMKIIFFYPGGQGNQEQAQPILDSFSEALNKASQGKINANITYISDPKAGIQFIQSQKPTAGILSLDVYYREAQAWGLEVLAKTLQLPQGDGTDQYFIVGPANLALPASGTLKVFSSRALDAEFIKSKLFPKLSLSLEIQHKPNVVLQLRRIGKGEEQAWVLLDEFEYSTISRSQTEWAKNLKVAAPSEKISSAPFVVFKNNLPAEQSAPLLEALLKISQDPEAQETLGMLRIKGFEKASSPQL